MKMDLHIYWWFPKDLNLSHAITRVSTMGVFFPPSSFFMITIGIGTGGKRTRNTYLYYNIPGSPQRTSPGPHLQQRCLSSAVIPDLRQLIKVSLYPLPSTCSHHVLWGHHRGSLTTYISGNWQDHQCFSPQRSPHQSTRKRTYTCIQYCRSAFGLISMIVLILLRLTDTELINQTLLKYSKVSYNICIGIIKDYLNNNIYETSLHPQGPVHLCILFLLWSY